MQNERRQHFRIDDRIRVAYSVIPRSDAQRDPYDLHFPITPRFAMFGELNPVEIALRNQLHVIDRESPDITGALRLINRKLNILLQALMPDLSLQELPVQQVNLSEGGIAFESPSPLTPGTPVHMQLMLPGGHGVALLAEAVASTSFSGGFRLGFRFTLLHDADRQTLAREILRRQPHSGATQTAS